MAALTPTKPESLAWVCSELRGRHREGCQCKRLRTGWGPAGSHQAVWHGAMSGPHVAGEVKGQLRRRAVDEPGTAAAQPGLPGHWLLLACHDTPCS